jgi:hypothetical protein
LNPFGKTRLLVLDQVSYHSAKDYAAVSVQLCIVAIFQVVLVACLLANAVGIVDAGVIKIEIRQVRLRCRHNGNEALEVEVNDNLMRGVESASGQRGDENLKFQGQNRSSEDRKVSAIETHYIIPECRQGP